MLYLFLQASNLFCHLFRASNDQSFPLASSIVPFAISPLYEPVAEYLWRGQYIVYTSNKRPGQSAAGENLEFRVCGISSFVENICIFLG